MKIPIGLIWCRRVSEWKSEQVKNENLLQKNQVLSENVLLRTTVVKIDKFGKEKEKKRKKNENHFALKV